MRTRSIRHRNARKKHSLCNIEITSLLDILIIILVFLLKNYNASGIIFSPPRGLKLPDSTSVSLSTAGVAIQMSKKSLWVDNKKIIDNIQTDTRLYDHGGRRIIPLYNELIKKKKMVHRIKKSTDKAKKFSGIVNLLVDKSIGYKKIRKILYTCSLAGFVKFKFVVLNENT